MRKSKNKESKAKDIALGLLLILFTLIIAVYPLALYTFTRNTRTLWWYLIYLPLTYISYNSMWDYISITRLFWALRDTLCSFENSGRIVYIVPSGTARAIGAASECFENSRYKGAGYALTLASVYFGDNECRPDVFDLEEKTSEGLVIYKNCRWDKKTPKACCARSARVIAEKKEVTEC